MTKKSLTRLEDDGVIPPAPLPKRNLTPEETIQLQEMLRAVNIRKFEAAQIKGNTALVPRGQEIAAETEAIAQLLENAKNLWVSQTLIDCGYPADTKCSINLTTGEVVENDVPVNNRA